MLFFFFKQKTAYEMRISDWSSDVCSSDLLVRSPAAIGELDRQRLADDDHPGGDQPLHDRRGHGRAAVAPGVGAARRDTALDLDQILQGARDDVQRTDPMAGADRLPGGFRRDQGVIAIYVDDGA